MALYYDFYSIVVPDMKLNDIPWTLTRGRHDDAKNSLAQVMLDYPSKVIEFYGCNNDNTQ